MLKVSSNGNYVYLQKQFGVTKEEFAKDCENAKFSLDGQTQPLKFDGKVEDAILDRLDATERDHTITDLKTLAKGIDSFYEAKPNLDKGEMANLELGGEEWSGIKRKSHPKAASDYEYVFSNPNSPGQSVIFTDNNRVKLRTQAESGSITHEAVGKMFRNEDSGGKYKDDSVFCLSESVKISNR